MKTLKTEKKNWMQDVHSKNSGLETLPSPSEMNESKIELVERRFNGDISVTTTKNTKNNMINNNKPTDTTKTKSPSPPSM